MAFIPLIPIRSRPQLSTHYQRHATCRTTPSMTATVSKIFTISKTVMPSDSDYSFALWHGSYIRWLEEARVRYLTYRNLPYEQLVQSHATELVVRDIRIRYLSPAKLGEDVTVSIRMDDPNGRVRIVLHSDFVRVSDGTLCASAEVTIVPIDTATGKVRRVWPNVLTDALIGDSQ